MYKDVSQLEKNHLVWRPVAVDSCPKCQRRQQVASHFEIPSHLLTRRRRRAGHGQRSAVAARRWRELGRNEQYAMRRPTALPSAPTDRASN